MALATPAADVSVASPQSLTPWECGDPTHDAEWLHVADVVIEAQSGYALNFSGSAKSA
jgi:hypothetical protein